MNKTIDNKLKRNWSSGAASMDCDAECAIHDPFTRVTWYLYGKDTCLPAGYLCIEDDSGTLDPEKYLPVEYLQEIFIFSGQEIKLDPEFRPRNAKTLYMELKKKYDN